MNIGEIETNLEQIEVDIEKTEKEKELESRESNIKNAIAQLEHDIQISEKIEKIVLEIHDEKQIVDNIMFSFKNRIKEISKKLSDMYKDTLEEINVLNKLDVLGEDVADSMSVLEERMNFVFESQNHLYELSECYGLNDILDYDDLKEEVEMIGEFIEPQRKKSFTVGKFR